jgi:NADPH:quinone reductase-like Zn-dependent oxidoreductase
VEAASVNGFDVAVAAGYVWDMLPHEFPVVLGRDVAGTVESLGDGVEGLVVGDRVATVINGVGLGPQGTMAERFTVAASDVSAVPAGVSAVQAAAVGLAGLTALDVVTALDLGPDDVVLVSGATGGVGTYAVQLAARSGARVIATARPGPGDDTVRGLGAQDVVDHTGDVPAGVRALTADGVTAVVHAAGEPGPLGTLLAPGGRLVSVLGADEAAVGRDDVAVTGVVTESTAAKLTELLDAVATGTLTVTIAATFPLNRAGDALAAFGSSKVGKIVVTAP